MVVLIVLAAAAAMCAAVGVWWYHNTFGHAPCTRAFMEPGAAMQPTIQPGDSVCADTSRYGNHDPSDGEVVVFEPPAILGTLPFTKRIVAGPGDTVAMRRGRTYVNGTQVYEPYISTPASYSLQVRNFDIYVDETPLDPSRAQIPPKDSWSRQNWIPKGYYLVLGDNRNNSDDSHLWGFVRRDQLIGRVTSIYWPLSRVRTLSP